MGNLAVSSLKTQWLNNCIRLLFKDVLRFWIPTSNHWLLHVRPSLSLWMIMFWSECTYTGAITLLYKNLTNHKWFYFNMIVLQNHTIHPHCRFYKTNMEWGIKPCPIFSLIIPWRTIRHIKTNTFSCT